MVRGISGRNSAKHKRDGNEEQRTKGALECCGCRRNDSVWLDRVVEELREWVEWLEGRWRGCRWCKRNAGQAGEVGLG